MTGNRHWRSIAGNLELFIGAYLVDLGLLGLLFFHRIGSRNGMFGSAAAIVVGLMLLSRARLVLAWHGAIFWMVTLLAIVVPVGILLPALLR
jgi:hypothetical protein